MTDRDVSWGEEVSEPVVVPKVQEKKEKEPMATPEWSIDTRGDLPTERALGSNESSKNKVVTLPSWPEEEYNAAVSDFPKSIQWSMLSLYETVDGTTGTQDLACAAGYCEVVDITS